MSAEFATYVALRCDGCKVVYGEPGEFTHPADARISARGLGWTLVPKRLRSGKLSGADLSTWEGLNKATGYATDMCPKCEGCNVCAGSPPTGFTCNDCGRTG